MDTPLPKISWFDTAKRPGLSLVVTPEDQTSIRHLMEKMPPAQSLRD